jgi:hypothetical protein
LHSPYQNGSTIHFTAAGEKNVVCLPRPALGLGWDTMALNPRADLPPLNKPGVACS